MFSVLAEPAYFHTLSIQAVRLARLGRWPCSLEPSLVPCVIRTKISCTGSSAVLSQNDERFQILVPVKIIT